MNSEVLLNVGWTSVPRGFSLASLALRLIVSDAVVNGGKCEVRYCDGTLIKQ